MNIRSQQPNTVSHGGSRSTGGTKDNTSFITFGRAEQAAREAAMLKRTDTSISANGGSSTGLASAIPNSGSTLRQSASFASSYSPSITSSFSSMNLNPSIDEPSGTAKARGDAAPKNNNRFYNAPLAQSLPKQTNVAINRSASAHRKQSTSASLREREKLDKPSNLAPKKKNSAAVKRKLYPLMFICGVCAAIGLIAVFVRIASLNAALIREAQADLSLGELSDVQSVWVKARSFIIALSLGIVASFATWRVPQKALAAVSFAMYLFAIIRLPEMWMCVAVPLALSALSVYALFAGVKSTKRKGKATQSRSRSRTSSPKYRAAV